MEFPSDYIRILVAAIYAITLFYRLSHISALKKELIKFASLGDVMKELRDVDRELAKIPSGSQNDEVRSSWLSRMFNSLEWLWFMINEKIMTDKKLVKYVKPMIISYYDDTFLKCASAIKRDSTIIHNLKNSIKM